MCGGRFYLRVYVYVVITPIISVLLKCLFFLLKTHSSYLMLFQLVSLALARIITRALYVHYACSGSVRATLVGLFPPLSLFFLPLNADVLLEMMPCHWFPE